MAELPELRAHAERLDRDLAGAVLERFVATSPSVLEAAARQPSVAHRHPVAYIGHRGRHLLIDFGVVTFVVSIPPGGRLLRIDSPPDAILGLERATWGFADGRQLALTEVGPEVRSRVWVVSGDPEKHAPLMQLGPDADEVRPPQLLALLRGHPMQLGDFLMDQRIVAGLGRRLAGEVCHRARLSPSASTGELGTVEAAALVEAIHARMNEALANARGRTDVDGLADRPGNVHLRVGRSCRVCGDTIRELGRHGEGVAYCPTCQKGS